MLCSYRRRALFAAVLPYRSALVPYRSAPVVRSPWPPRASFPSILPCANFPKASLLDRRLEVTFDAVTNRRRPRPSRAVDARELEAIEPTRDASREAAVDRRRRRGPGDGRQKAVAPPVRRHGRDVASRAQARRDLRRFRRGQALDFGPGAAERAIIEAKKRPPRTSAATCRRGAAAPAASRRRWPSRRRGSCRAGTPRRARPAPPVPAGASCGCR